MRKRLRELFKEIEDTKRKLHHWLNSRQVEMDAEWDIYCIEPKESFYLRKAGVIKDHTEVIKELQKLLERKHKEYRFYKRKYDSLCTERYWYIERLRALDNNQMLLDLGQDMENVELEVQKNQAKKRLEEIETEMGLR